VTLLSSLTLRFSNQFVSTFTSVVKLPDHSRYSWPDAVMRYVLEVKKCKTFLLLVEML
jgi:hypothetical protein